MKIEHEPLLEDGGGDMIVTAENTSEVVELMKHFRLLDDDVPENLIKRAEAIQSGRYVHRVHSKRRPMYRNTSSLDFEWSAPYLKRLELMTGFGSDGGVINEIDLLKYLPDRLYFTHYLIGFGIDGGLFVYDALNSSEPWNGRTAVQYAEISTARAVQNRVGSTPVVHEYIENGNGTISRNHEWGKYHPPRPALGSAAIFNSIFQWWRENHADDRQKALLAATEDFHKVKNLCGKDYEVSDCGQADASYKYDGMYIADPAGKINWDGKGSMARKVSWDEFAGRPMKVKK